MEEARLGIKQLLTIAADNIYGRGNKFIGGPMKAAIINKIKEIRERKRKDQFERPAVYVPERRPNLEKREPPKTEYSGKVIVIDLM